MRRSDLIVVGQTDRAHTPDGLSFDFPQQVLELQEDASTPPPATATARWSGVAAAGIVAGLGYAYVLHKGGAPRLVTALPLALTWAGPGLLWLLDAGQVGGVDQVGAQHLHLDAVGDPRQLGAGVGLLAVVTWQAFGSSGGQTARGPASLLRWNTR